VILADSSVWIDHLRSADPQVTALVARSRIVMHPFVVAEIALGSLRNRRRTLEPLEGLRQVRVAQIGEVRRMIEAHALYSRGIGLIDAHLIASCLLTPGTRLWTRDTRLQSVARSLSIAADMSPTIN
jgi:predicted nucleic acid-binding protein